jgi:hypothetical protein
MLGNFVVCEVGDSDIRTIGIGNSVKDVVVSESVLLKFSSNICKLPAYMMKQDGHVCSTADKEWHILYK